MVVSSRTSDCRGGVLRRSDVPLQRKNQTRFEPCLIQRPVLKGQPGHGHLCEDIGDGAGIVLDIDAPADIGRGVAHTIASDDRAANIDRISPAARKVEGSFGNDDTFKVDTTVEFDVTVDHKNPISERAIP